MSVFFVSDLHLGHRTILRHTREVVEYWKEKRPNDLGPVRNGATVDEHDEWVISRLNAVNPNKRTMWYILGDVAMDEDKLKLLNEVEGRKILVSGNHDTFPTEMYLRYFERVTGGFKKYGMWLTHIPVHSSELRGGNNIHGHTHHHTTFGDARYRNVCIEWLVGNRPISLDQLRQEEFAP